MKKIPVYSLEGKETSTLELNEAVFGVKAKRSIVHQVYVSLIGNMREPWAHTKTRGDVRGGGKKPWKQKGTGRARHGSIRSPIWKGGGVTFGPSNERNYARKINAKMKQVALRMCLSGFVSAERMYGLEDAAFSGKTKQLATLRAALPGNGKSTLIVTAKKDEAVMRAARNMPNVDVVRADDVNVVDMLHHQHMLVTGAALKSLERRLA